MEEDSFSILSKDIWLITNDKASCVTPKSLLMICWVVSSVEKLWVPANSSPITPRRKAKVWGARGWNISELRRYTGGLRLVSLYI